MSKSTYIYIYTYMHIYTDTHTYIYTNTLGENSERIWCMVTL